MAADAVARQSTEILSGFIAILSMALESGWNKGRCGEFCGVEGDESP
jgi:hypothetical protein